MTLFRSTQALPQAAQFAFVPSAISHPSTGWRLQSRYPGEQSVTVQLPELHDAVLWGSRQDTPQAPQFVAELSWLSQPLGALLSQLPKPGSQLGTQAKVPGEPWHGFVPWALVQALPQVAQFVVVPSVVSQPGDDELQSAYPPLQVPMLQVMVVPAMVHVAGAFGNEHDVPQLPQSLSVTTLRSQPLSGLLSQLL